MNRMPLVLVCAILAGALWIAACTDQSAFLKPSIPSVHRTHDYQVTNTICQSWTVLNVPPSVTKISSSTPGGWISEFQLSNGNAFVKECVNDSYTVFESDECDRNPFASGCQPIIPTLDNGSTNFGGGGGGGGIGSGSPLIWELTVSKCDYHKVADTRVDTDVWYRASLVMECNRPFKEWEERALRMGVDSLMKDTISANFPSEADRARCAEIRRWLADAMAAGIDFSVGRSNSTTHDGEAILNTRIGHVDPKLFEAVYFKDGQLLTISGATGAYRNLVATAAHEAAHAWGNKDHPSAGPEDIIYTDLYFSQLNQTTQPNQCTK